MRKYSYLLLLLLANASHASVVVGATRVIFDGAKKNASINVENKDKTTNIIQSWLSPVDASSSAKDAFVITPPLFKLKAGGQGFVRIVRTGKALPEDRESMFWLNVKGIPALDKAPTENIVQFAINSKIKLIYRPASLKGSTPEKVASELQWYNENMAIKVKNPSSLYINFAQISINSKDISGGWFVAPHGELTISIPAGLTSSASGKQEITWSVINDYGMSNNKYRALVN